MSHCAETPLVADAPTKKGKSQALSLRFSVLQANRCRGGIGSGGKGRFRLLHDRCKSRLVVHGHIRQDATVEADRWPSSGH
jgi:hypothetical protein